MPVFREDDLDRLAIDAMLLLENARRQPFFGIVVKYWDGSLQNNRAGIELLIYEMDCAATDLDSVLKRLLLGIQSRKCRQQRGMNVQNPHRESPAELGAEQSHEASQANQLD